MEYRKVLFVEPEKEPRVGDLPWDYNEIKKIIPGDWKYHNLEDNIMVLANKGINHSPEPLNRRVDFGDGLVEGTFVVLEWGKEQIVDISHEKAEFYTEKYKEPGKFPPKWEFMKQLEHEKQAGAEKDITPNKGGAKHKPDRKNAR